MDRFLLHLRLDLPGAEDERAILDLSRPRAGAAWRPCCRR